MSTTDTLDAIEPDVPVEPETIPGPVGLARKDDQSDTSWRYSVEYAVEARDALSAGMRELVELVTTRDLTWPDNLGAWGWNRQVRATWDATDEATFRELRRAVGSALTSPWEKDTRYGKLEVSRDVSTFLRVTIRASWGTCEQVEVGTKTVTRTVSVCPDCESELIDLDNGGQACSDDTCQYEVRPAKRIEREETVPELEWRCPEVADL